MTLNVNEIFYSIQGEGYHSGSPATFIRLAGCNLACHFCDTRHTVPSIPMTPQAIVDEVKQYPAELVIITGGEPSLQPLSLLVDMLHEAARRVHIETNGTRPLPHSIDWITCSPKKATAESPLRIPYYVHPSILHRADELKLVYDPEGPDPDSIAARFHHPLLYLQPMALDGSDNAPATVAYILSHPHWRLSAQIHRLLNFR
ncbi:MAG: 7-carboxy-7-deazaguanine synthase QueE [Muribaculaceae bacterium]|nr:7-carboxy-7-deazaguanine synthase QueE [Muribaculaceae bacterium]